MESRVNPQDIHGDRQLSTSPCPLEDKQNSGPNMSTVSPLPDTATLQPTGSERAESNLGNQQGAILSDPSNDLNVPVCGGTETFSVVHTSPAPIIPVSTSASPQLVGNKFPISAQSASHLIQEALPGHSQDAGSSRPSEDTPFSSGETRPLMIREATQSSIPPRSSTFSSPPLIQSLSEHKRSSTQDNVQSRRWEDTRFLTLTNNMTTERQLPQVPKDGGIEEIRTPPQARTVVPSSGGRGQTQLDWIVPVQDKPKRKATVGERLQPTLARAHAERHSFSVKAKVTGWTLNVAIFLQVLLGSITTGVAAASSDGKHAAIVTTVLGALSTIVASFLARARGSNEPELSVSRVKDLEQFIRELDAFQLDHGDSTSNEFDDQVHRFRTRFEDLLGNLTNQSVLGPQAAKPETAKPAASNV